jgi:hypothetical protein
MYEQSCFLEESRKDGVLDRIGILPSLAGMGGGRDLYYDRSLEEHPVLAALAGAAKLRVTISVRSWYI